MAISLKRAALTLKETLHEDFNLLARAGAAVDSLVARTGLSPVFRMAAYGSVTGLGLGMAMQHPVQALGFAAFSILQMSPVMLHNRHKRANVFMGAALLAPQLLLLGAPTGALQAGVAGMRALTMNTIDDGSYRTRVTVSAGFWAGTVAFAFNAGLVTSAWSFVPLAAMTCGTIADACSDRKTHIARLGRLCGGMLNVPYHMAVSGSLGALAGEVLAVTNLFRTAVQNDVPARDDGGRMLTTGQQIGGWWQSIRKGQRIEADRAGVADPLLYPLRMLRRGRHPS